MAEEALAITIVDDDPAVLDSLQTIFEVEGFEVRAFADGDRFLAEAQRIRTDCLFSTSTCRGARGSRSWKRSAASTIRPLSSSSPARATFRWR